MPIIDMLIFDALHDLLVKILMKKLFNRKNFKDKLSMYADIKTHGSESRGQEEAVCTRVFWPTQPLQ